MGTPAEPSCRVSTVRGPLPAEDDGGIGLVPRLDDVGPAVAVDVADPGDRRADQAAVLARVAAQNREPSVPEVLEVDRVAVALAVDDVDASADVALEAVLADASRAAVGRADHGVGEAVAVEVTRAGQRLSREIAVVVADEIEPGRSARIHGRARRGAEDDARTTGGRVPRSSSLSPMRKSLRPSPLTSPASATPKASPSSA